MGTKFDLDGKEQGDWFPFFGSKIDISSGEIAYDDPEEGAGEFCIRSMQPYWDEAAKGKKKESKFVLNPISRGMDRVTWLTDLPAEEEAAESEGAWDFAITGFRNVLGPDGAELECTIENKMKLVKIPMVFRFLNRVFTLISESGISRAEGLEKNSSSGLDG